MKFYFTTLLALVFLAVPVRAQTTAFTYQGQLNSNNVPATGAFDLRFQIFNANNSVVAGPLTNAPVGVTNGLFITTLDFGPGVFDGTTRSLEIGVRTNGNTNAYIVLSPRQTLTSVPYAIQAINASNAVALTVPLQATNLAGTIPNSLLSPNVAVLTNNVVFSGGVTATNFTGNGYGLSNVPATSLTGTLPDVRLSANVALYNANASFSNGVTAVVFSGSGRWLTNVPGAFFWITNAGTSSQILPNWGYIATNDTAPVVFTLPSSPIAGDVYKVAGVGAGGWIIAQNANQTIAAGNLSHSIGQNWKATVSIVNWSAIASSASGTKLVATINFGQIYTSTNSGATWTPQAGSLGSLYWSSVASSADGTKLVATVGDTAFGSATGYIYTSADSGVTWVLHNSSPVNTALAWSSVASSADGTKLVAVAYGDQIYTSVNSGTSWTKQTASSLGNKSWTCVASSAGGTNLVAAVNGGYIYTSTDSGVHWAYQPGSGNGTLLWSALASSSDGVNLIAATTGNSGQIYTSSNFGTNWTAQTVSSTASASWSSVASSADGSHLAAVYNAIAPGNIFTSDDFGATWTERNGASSAAWSGVASSADGSQLAATATTYGNSGIYVSSQSSTTTGTAGYLIGPQHSAIELIYTGNNLFLPLSHEGTIRAY
jgi:hypothetical protein